MLPAAALDRAVGGQKTISLSALMKLGPTEAGWDELAGCVGAAAATG